MGETCTISVGDASAELTVDNSSNSNGFGMDGGGFGSQGGQMPQRPGGDLPDGEMPQRPGGGFPDGETPEDGFPGGGDWRGDRFPQWGQDQAWDQGGAAETAAAISPETFLSVGVSALVLLAGIWFAFKVKH